MTKNTKKKTNWSISAFDMFGSPVAFNINGNEQYKTVIGCFWTFIMTATLIGSSYWYFTSYLDPTNVEVTTEMLIQDEYPYIDFASHGFFFSLSATQSGKLVRIDDLSNVLTFEATQRIFDSKIVNGERSNPIERTPIEISFSPCKRGGKENVVDGQTIEGKSSMATSDRAWCSFVNTANNESMFVNGNEDSDVYAYIRIKITPCNNTDPECLFYYLTVPSDDEGGTWEQCQRFKNTAARQATQLSEIYYGPDDECDCGMSGTWGTTNWTRRCENTITLIKEEIYKQIGNIYFTFNYVEAAVKPENYEQPFSYSMKSNVKSYGSIESTKIVNMFFRESQVRTDKGLVREIFEIKSSVAFDSVMTDFYDRGEGKTKEELRPSGATESVPQSFIEFALFSSNNRIILTRKYSKILDVFANVGGTAEVIAFFVIFFYAWYNGIKMEQKLLNYGVMNKSEIKAEDKSSFGQVAEKWERSRYFGFFELLKFGMMEKGMGFCFRKDEKYDLYHQTRETYERRTDVINIMKTVADVDTIKDALFEQYQIRLLPYLSNQKLDDDDDVLRMSIKQAVKELNLEKNTKNMIIEKMDSYLRTHLPNDILMGNTGILDLGRFPIAGKMEMFDVMDGEGSSKTPNVDKRHKTHKPQHVLRKRKNRKEGKGMKMNFGELKVVDVKRKSKWDDLDLDD